MNRNPRVSEPRFPAQTQTVMGRRDIHDSRIDQLKVAAGSCVIYLLISLFLLAPPLSERELTGSGIGFVAIGATSALVFLTSYYARRWHGMILLLGVSLLTLGAALLFIYLGLVGILAGSLAMYLATYMWFFGLTGVTVVLIPRMSQTRIRPTIACVALLGVLVTGVPFISDGMDKSAAPRGYTVTAVDQCDPAKISVISALQYVVTSSADEPVPSEWEEAEIVAFVNGQALEKLYWPPLMANNEWMHRRYVAHGINTGGSGEQRALDEGKNAFMSAISLGRSRPVDSSGRVNTPCF